jgi:acetyl esterase/lipase
MASRWAAAGNEAELEIIAEAVHGFVAYPIAVAERELAAQLAFITTAVTKD